MTRVFITEIKRSAIGKYLGSLAPLSPIELGAQVARAVLQSENVPEVAIEEVIVGNVLSAGHGQNIARQIAIKAGLSEQVPAYTVNMVCGSGMKAAYEGFAKIKAGLNEVLLVGGSESMSQAAYVLSGKSRLGMGVGQQALEDSMMRDGLTDAFDQQAMGMTAENLVTQFEISRQAQDAFAYQSQVKARAARDAGKFQQEIVPVTYQTRKGETITVARDEYINDKSTPEKLATLRPAFKKDGSVTAGNSSGINDGAAFMCLVSEAALARYQLTPLAEVVGFGQAGVAPDVMGLGPVEAVAQVLTRSQVAPAAVDLFELNEAFAAQALAVEQRLAEHLAVEPEWLSARTNVNGGAIALGHPIGASGARIMTGLVYELHRRQQQYGVASLCIGGGMGIAVLLRRVETL